ncbi:MAG: hypothetical protein CM15mP115_04520 [Alphaproteobacteria bacterium]|nr:MAG: hypothetical protein CM15mP115_04520 [Alphaproteobacteria bacterium]
MLFGSPPAHVPCCLFSGPVIGGPGAPTGVGVGGQPDAKSPSAPFSPLPVLGALQVPSLGVVGRQKGGPTSSRAPMAQRHLRPHPPGAGGPSPGGYEGPRVGGVLGRGALNTGNDLVGVAISLTLGPLAVCAGAFRFRPLLDPCRRACSGRCRTSPGVGYLCLPVNLGGHDHHHLDGGDHQPSPFMPPFFLNIPGSGRARWSRCTFFGLPLCDHSGVWPGYTHRLFTFLPITICPPALR